MILLKSHLLYYHTAVAHDLVDSLCLFYQLAALTINTLWQCL
jgi:hypothetical protein